MPQPDVDGPKAKITSSELLNAISTIQTGMRITTLTTREIRTKISGHIKMVPQHELKE